MKPELCGSHFWLWLTTTERYGHRYQNWQISPGSPLRTPKRHCPSFFNRTHTKAAELSGFQAVGKSWITKNTTVRAWSIRRRIVTFVSFSRRFVYARVYQAAFNTYRFNGMARRQGHQNRLGYASRSSQS